jgi:hypothetical protein
MATTNIAPREPIKKQMAKLAMPQSNVLLQFNQGYSATRRDGLGNDRVWVEFWCRLSIYDCVDGLDR